jgi:urease accessory protein
MLRLHGVIGNEKEPTYRAHLHALEHSGGLEYLFVPSEDAERRRFRATTDRGADCAVSLDRDEKLSDGAILHIDETRAIIVRFGEPRIWRLRAKDMAAALKLGWNAGNLHWRVRFEGDTLAVPLDGPVEQYRARIAALLASGEVSEDV